MEARQQHRSRGSRVALRCQKIRSEPARLRPSAPGGEALSRLNGIIEKTLEPRRTS